MTRPDWCPADVWEAAGLQLVGRAHLEPSDREWVARAILAERERCAAIADHHSEILRGNLARYEAIAVEGVAKAIRGTL